MQRNHKKKLLYSTHILLTFNIVFCILFCILTRKLKQHKTTLTRKVQFEIKTLFLLFDNNKYITNLFYRVFFVVVVFFNFLLLFIFRVSSTYIFV